MQVGFEAKRVFQNATGLGNYARNLIDSLSRYAPLHHYHLFAPKQTTLFPAENYKNVSVHTPKSFLNNQLKSYWRSKTVVHDIAAQPLDIYHGLSAELPRGLEKLSIAKMVSVHDLIYERYPAQYNPLDVYISRKKTKHACRIADMIAAMSEQTKQDLIDYYHIPSSKIVVTYQSCHEDFLIKKSNNELRAIQVKYNLPEIFFLSVGSIIERKGLLKICQALKHLPEKIPLVVIGRGSNAYHKKVKEYIVTNNMQTQVIFLNDVQASSDNDFTSGKDFPAIFQSAKALIYPSMFEGFGIPVLEAISSGVPVITSRVSSMPEAAGDAALYVDPASEEEIADAMTTILNDDSICNQLTKKGLSHAQNFTKEKIADQMIGLYKSLL